METGFQLISENGVIPNLLTLEDEALLNNLRSIQSDRSLHNGHTLPLSEVLESRDFSIEMETGTGKTYVYLRTALQLNKAYGFRKYIVIVPSVAIREGVLKTLDITREHFARLFDNVPYRYYQYDSGNLTHVRHFASSNDVEIMVMTLDSFNKDSNIFNRRMDRMMGLMPLELVRATRPILILDEPQNMESELSKEALASLNPLFKLRYSASHRQLYNLIYRLTPIDAYNLRLVKQIEVASVVQEHDLNQAYIQCKSIDAKKNVVSSKLKLYVRDRSGSVPRTRTVRQGDDLSEITGLEVYDGFVVERLDVSYGEIRFTNGVVVKQGQELGPDHESIAKVQIRYTIEEHMRKAERLRQLGIKVLSLFFIDQVPNYAEEDGYIRRVFTEQFQDLASSDQSWAQAYKDRNPQRIQGSYFSNYVAEASIESDADAYDLIMRDKERLLSFDEPVEFIFSHSALREGWDNPNIFQICTLNRTISPIRKRQEIGRGMRLPVNQEGQRIKDEQVNRLTVVANESYREYVDRLQKEYEEDVGSGQEPPVPKDARKRKTVRLKKGFELNPEFKELWERISTRTQYRVTIDSEALITSCTAALKGLMLEPVRILIEKGQVVEISRSSELKERLIGQGQIYLSDGESLPDVVHEIASTTHLTRRTVGRLLLEAGILSQAKNNPAEFVQRVSDRINQCKREYLVNGLSYVPVDDAYRLSLFHDLEAYEDNLLPIEKSIYDQVIHDSNVEKDFAAALDDMDEVKLFIKLPAWFIVPTPIGSYNPDWAIVFYIQDEFGEVKERLYLVRETKGSEDTDQLRENERMKIDCAKHHFDAIGVDFRRAADADQLREHLRA